MKTRFAAKYRCKRRRLTTTSLFVQIAAGGFAGIFLGLLCLECFKPGRGMEIMKILAGL